MIDINEISDETETNTKKERIKKAVKREIRGKIEILLEDNKGNILSEEYIRVVLLDQLISLHNKLDLGNNDIDFYKLLREVFNTMYCEYFPHNTSKQIRCLATSVRIGPSNTLTDHIGFKW